MIRFSANLTMLYPEHGLFLDRFAAAARDGFTAVEFVSPYAFAPQQVADAARAAGVAIALFNSPAGEWEAGERGFACDPSQQSRFQKTIALAADYGAALACSKLHIMAGNIPPGVSVQEAERVYIENLRWAAAYLAERAMVALIEPINAIDMPGYGLSSLAQAERVLDAVAADNLLLQYDFYHMAMMGEDLIGNFVRLQSKIGHVQIADAPGRHEPGTGTIDFPAIFQALMSSGYAGFVGAEYRPRSGTSEGLSWRTSI